MTTIEEMALANYQINMEFFKTSHHELYTKINALESLLQDGRFPQKYELEYQNDYFDVIELSSQHYLYNQNSQSYSKTLSENVSFQKDTHVFETFYNYDFTDLALEKIKTSDATTMHSTTAPIIAYHNANINKSMQMKNVQKFIFLGLGLALHLPEIIKKTGAKGILIIEDDIELFRLSLFTCNYKESLQDCTPFFSIAQNSQEFNDTFNAFYTHSFIWNHYLKFSLFSSMHEAKIKTIQSLILTRSEKAYPHEFLLYKNLQVLNRLQEGYNFLNLTKQQDPTFFTTKPTLVLGAGPSLQKHLVWLKQHHESFIIIAAFASLKTLYKHNISPDIVVQIDEKVIATENLLNSFDDFDFLRNTQFIFSASVPDILMQRFDKKNIYLIEDRTRYKTSDTYLSSASVGETAYAIALMLNASNIYLLGLDFALGDDGSTHSKDHHLTSSLDTSTANEVQQSASMTDSVIHVKGNFKDTVVTTPLLSMSIPILNTYTKNFKQEHQTVFNLCDGAYLNNTIALEIDHISSFISLLNHDISSSVTEYLYAHSRSFLDIQETQSLRSRASQVQELLVYIKAFEEAATSQPEIFLQLYTSLLQNILKSTSSELHEVLGIYFLNSATWVMDMFNTKELENPKKHTKKIKKIIINQLEKIIRQYEDTLLKIIKETQL